MSITLPVDGQLDWGDELNTAISQVETDAANAQNAIDQHAANFPTDPHGDRSYANSLVSPILAGVNLPNGLVQLNADGTIPPQLIAQPGSVGGTFTNVYDVVATYGAPRNNGQDASVAIQNALNDAAAAGGGEVWVPAGVYSLADYVVIGSNTWLHLAEGAWMRRIVGLSTPPYLLTNCRFGTNDSPGAQNIMVSGGRWDAVGIGNLTASCTAMFFIQVTKLTIKDLIINSVFNNCAIELNGCKVVKLEHIHFTGIGSNFLFATVPACRLNSSSLSTTPAGLANSLYNNAICQAVSMNHIGTDTTTFANNAYGAVAGSDLHATGFDHGPVTTVGAYSVSTLANNLLSANWSQHAEAGNSFA